MHLERETVEETEMGFNISPGVYTTEIDLTNIIPSVSTTEGALGGVFRWGPVGQRVLVDSEKTLADRFGKPTNHNAETFFTAASFLAYANKLYVVRAANTSANSTSIANASLSAVGTANGVASNTQLATSVIKNSDDFEGRTFDAGVFYVAKYPGALGNSLKVSVCDSTAAYQSVIPLAPNTNIDAVTSLANYVIGSDTAVVTIVPSGTGTLTTAQAVGTSIITGVAVGDYLKVGNTTIGTQYMRVKAVANTVVDGANVSVTISLDSKFSLGQNHSANNVERVWEYYNLVNRAPRTSLTQSTSVAPTIKDEMHVVVADEDGAFTGTPGAVLEVYEALSRNSEAKDESGSSVFYKSVINNNSAYVWTTRDLTSAVTGTSTTLIDSTALVPARFSLANGQDGLNENAASLASLSRAYDLFTTADEIDISLILQGVAKGGSNGSGLANYLIDNIASVRKDCVVLISPPRASVVGAVGNELNNVLAFRDAINNSSYAFMDSGYKYTYDKYNDVYRYVPLNGDIAGIMARNDSLADPWFSPGGYNRGGVKNVYKLAWNPNQAQRDQLYKSDVNPVVSLAGNGPVLYGDKTLLGRPSAFDRVNVRRLFIVLEKAIARASASTLFELNDEFTRAQFRNMIEPYLRDVQGRRGIYDFKVVCDETNNTPQVIDTNGFAGDIYIKPARSINTIQLNFVAVRTGVEFSEIVGKF